MKKLTLKYAIENKFTPCDCVKYYYPKATDEFCGFMLWERTCFPMDMKTTLNQLYKEYINDKKQ